MSRSADFIGRKAGEPSINVEYESYLLGRIGFYTGAASLFMSTKSRDLKRAIREGKLIKFKY